MDDTTELFRVAYKHDFSGMCAPSRNGSSMFNTFSVGIFQWLPKASGKGLKKSAVKFRVKGNVSEAKKVYREAKIWCYRMDRNIIPKTKSMTV